MRPAVYPAPGSASSSSPAALSAAITASLALSSRRRACSSWPRSQRSWSRDRQDARAVSPACAAAASACRSASSTGSRRSINASSSSVSGASRSSSFSPGTTRPSMYGSRISVVLPRLALRRSLVAESRQALLFLSKRDRSRFDGFHRQRLDRRPAGGAPEVQSHGRRSVLLARETLELGQGRRQSRLLARPGRGGGLTLRPPRQRLTRGF